MRRPAWPPLCRGHLAASWHPWAPNLALLSLRQDAPPPRAVQAVVPLRVLCGAVPAAGPGPAAAAMLAALSAAAGILASVVPPAGGPGRRAGDEGTVGRGPEAGGAGKYGETLVRVGVASLQRSCLLVRGR